MKTPLLLLGLALACALWAPDAEASTIFRTQNNLSLAKGLVGWWNFDGKTVSGTRVFDASGTGNYGTMTNGPTLTEGKLGQGMKFDGENDFVRVPYSSSFDLTDSLTLSAWVRPAKGESGILEKSISQVYNRQYSMFIEGNVFKLRLVKLNVLHDIQSDTSFTPGIWYHIVGVWDGSTMRMFINSVQQTDTENVSAPIDSGGGNSPLTIGSLGDVVTDNPTYPWSGLLDDVRIYNRALSADEIKRLYNMGR